jgi:RNA-directed DNA polymerase
MEAVCERGNLRLAYQRVVENKGAAGVDGIGVAEFKAHLKQHWPSIEAKLLGGRYVPAAVRRVDIPKPQGGMRTLGIPTLTDRLIQQALHQVLQPIFEAGFSVSSYGFRPGKSAHQAVQAARQYVAAGRRVVVDLDLEKFFDRVNHDLLMGRLAQRIGDRRVLQLIRRYLTAGMMADGVVSPRTQGTPQGGPLSPLLSNILLTDLDRELERRGHAFCRYADDCNIYVRSRTAGERVMASLTRFLADTLKLAVNATKSAVAPPWERTFLGYSLTVHKAPRLRIAPRSRQRLVARVRQLLAAGGGAQPGPDHPGSQSGTAWLGGVLSAGRDQAGPGRTGWLGKAQTALPPVAAMEAALHACAAADDGRSGGGAGVPLRLQPAGTLVEQWCEPPAPGTPESLLRSLGAGVAA